MENSKSLGTPMSSTCSLDKDEEGKKVDEIKYRGMIGSLLYLTASRPDIMFSVCKCARFQSAPKESHLTAHFSFCPFEPSFFLVMSRQGADCYLSRLRGSDNQPPLASVASYQGKLPVDSDDSRSPKKKFKIYFDSSLDKKVDFWSASHEVLFHSLKDKTLVHGRVVDLDILSSLDYHIKNLFEFQGWANIFSVPMVVYEPLIRLFYANLRSPKAGKLESLVLGKHIFIDCKKFDSIFGISCFGIMAPLKNCWPFDCDVSYDQAKREIAPDPSKLIPSHLGPKDLPFESRVIAHIVATTLLSRAGSHSTLTQCDTLFVYCLVFGVKVHLSSFIITVMTDVIADPISLPFGILLTRIFEYQYMCLGDFSPVFIKQCYNSHAFQSMAKLEKLRPSTLTSVSTTKLTAALENLDAMHAKLDAMTITVSHISDVMTKLTAMGEQVDCLKDLLLAAHFKIDNVKDVSKETGADVAKIRLRLDQIVKESIKIATKVQAGSKAISISLSSRFEEMSIAIVNTLTYFLKTH
ncbi:hypothetical protein KY285_035895 [Solanum tuberosum]|nr:hypothetical protein KY289_036065 [Solanum tuberosum]KAH0639309.1 hypothetical protein KY285_035895 [Solanum tuberosum]